MPYIPKGERKLALTSPFTSGQLNYAITTTVDRFLDQEGVSYASLNAAIGVLECAKLELYRRVAAPYEDIKCAENGDVYTPL